MGLGIGRRFKKIFGGGLEGVLNIATLGIYGGIKSLFKTPDADMPAGLKNQGKAYNADLKINQAQLGEVRPKSYGRPTDWPPMLCGYTEFERNEQVYKAYLYLSHGPEQVNAIRIGTAPLTSFPGQKSQVCLPGEAMTLVHPNVYTSPDVETIDLRGSISATVVMRNRFSIAPSSGEGAAPNRILLYANSSLLNVPLGPVQLFETASNNGTFTVTSRGWSMMSSSLAVYSWIVVSEPLVTENVECRLEYGQDDLTAPTVKVEAVDLLFSNTDSKVTGPAESLADFVPGDVVRALGTPSNNGVNWTVFGEGDGATLHLTPAPNTESAPGASLVLVRRRAGPYPACLKGDKVDRVGLDMVCASLTNNGAARTVTLEARWREIDDAGNALGGWTADVFNLTNSDFKPYRMSHYITIDPPARVEVDLRRVTVESNSTSIRDAVTWAGLRGYVVAKDGVDPRVDAESTRLAIMVRSSGFLSRQQQRTVNVDKQALVPVWNGASWSAAQASRSPAWSSTDLIRTQSKGLFTAADIDLPAFLALAATAAARGETFSAMMDSEVLFWEGLTSILRVTRAKPLWDAARGKITVYRDEPTEPTLMFGDEINCELGPVQIATPTADTPTGVRVKYVDPLTWTEREDGPVAGTETVLREVSVLGIESWDRAYVDAYYQLMDLRYRTVTFSGSTEMEGLLARLGGRVLVGSTVNGWGVVMEVADVDGLVLTLSHPMVDTLNWVEGAQHYVHLQGENGMPTARINCSRVSEWKILLAAPHGITLRTGSSWRTVALIGHDAFGDIAASGPRLAMVEDMSADGLRQAQLQFRLDDARVHEDPSEIPEDPYAPSGTLVPLEVTGFVATYFPWILVSASWSAVADVLIYEVENQIFDNSWVRVFLGVATATTWSRKPGYHGTQARIRAYGEGGRMGPWTTVTITAA